MAAAFLVAAAVGCGRESVEIALVVNHTDGYCNPAGPLGVAVGDTWVLNGVVDLQVREDDESLVRTHLTTTYTVAALEDKKIVAGGSSEQIIDSSARMDVKLEHGLLNGRWLSTQTLELSSSTVKTVELGPVLSLSWECHKQAWLEKAGEGRPDDGREREFAVEDVVLDTGMEVVSFVSKEAFSETVDDEINHISITRETGYDKKTGRLVFDNTNEVGIYGIDIGGRSQVQELVAATP